MSDDNNRVLWGSGTSRVMRAHWALIELGLHYENIALQTRTPDMERADFLAINPAKKIPALQDGELVVTESAAIVTYLAERYSSAQCQLIPQDIASRARYFEWMSYITMELDATSLYVLRRHQDLKNIYGDAPMANDTARAYFDRMINAAAIRHGERTPFLLGSMFSGADILMVTCIDWAIRYGLPVPGHFISYRNHVAKRPAYEQALTANKKKARHKNA